MKRKSHGGNRAKRRARHFGNPNRAFRWTPLDPPSMTTAQFLNALERCWRLLDAYRPPELFLRMKSTRPR